MKYPTEHIETVSKTDAQAIVDDLGLGQLPTYGQRLELVTEASGRYLMVASKIGTYDVLYEQWRL